MRSSRERAEALHVEGVAANAKGQPIAAARLLRAALRHLDGAWERGAETDAEELRGRLLVSLAHSEAERGHVASGLQMLADAERLLPPDQHGVLHGQRGLLLLRTGKDAVALRELDAAIALLQSQNEPKDLARALLNRALLNLGFGRVRPAREDLHRSAELASRHDMPRVAAMCRHNLAYLDFLAGDLPAALKSYGVLSRDYAVLAPGLLAVLAVDRARALLAAGLYDEADEELASAINGFRRQRLSQDLAEAQLARAEAALLAGRASDARRWARLARQRFLRRDNARWAALAALVASRADFPRTGRSDFHVTQAQSLAETLRGFGLSEDGRVASLLAARALVAVGRLGDAGSALARCGRPGRADRLDTRLLWRLVHAELASALGRTGEASRHRKSGLAELERHRSQLGCLDLQTGASVHGRDLADAGLRTAIASGSPAQIYQWSERLRAQALRLPLVRPPEDAAAATALEELRQARHALRQAEVRGESGRALRARCDTLQRTIREHAWSASGPGIAGAMAPRRAVETDLAAAGAAMVVYLRDGQSLRALVISGGSVSLVGLGAFGRIEEMLVRLRVDLDAAAGRALPQRLAEAVTAATRRDAAVLSAAVFEPLLHLVGDRELVVVPTGTLVTLPWGVLPACAQRAVTVTPSATTWQAARRRRSGPFSAGRKIAALLVAGPGNERGETEVEAIAAVWPDASVLTGAAATPAATLAELNGAELAHVAAHGHHERGNALFSSFDLAGGPLMGYDLQRLDQTPAHVVLSSCDLGLSDVRPGDEALGMVTALLSTGSVTVVAGVGRVADDAASAVMVRYHKAINKGDRPAVALANAARPDQPTPFVCFGAEVGRGSTG